MDPQSFQSVNLDKDTLTNNGIPPLSPSVDWCVGMDFYYLTSSGITGSYDITGDTAEMKIYQYGTSTLMQTRTTEMTCTASGTAGPYQLGVDPVVEGRLLVRWTDDDLSPPPVGTYKYTISLENSSGAKEIAARGLLSVIN
jgi:hypothetical protein